MIVATGHPKYTQNTQIKAASPTLAGSDPHHQYAQPVHRGYDNIKAHSTNGHK